MKSFEAWTTEIKESQEQRERINALADLKISFDEGKSERTVILNTRNRTLLEIFKDSVMEGYKDIPLEEDINVPE